MNFGKEFDKGSTNMPQYVMWAWAVNTNKVRMRTQLNKRIKEKGLKINHLSSMKFLLYIIF